MSLTIRNKPLSSDNTHKPTQSRCKTNTFTTYLYFRIYVFSCQIDQETAPGRGALHGQSAGHRQAGARVYLFAAWRKRVRLEVNSDGHYAREFHKFNRFELQYHRDQVSAAKIRRLLFCCCCIGPHLHTRFAREIFFDIISSSVAR